MIRWLAWFACVVSLAGCASIDPYAQAPMARHLERSDDVGDCARLFRDLDARIDRAGARDAQAPRVPGFPYLRVDRFTASLGEAASQLRGAGFAAWSELMAHADRQARAAELANAAAVTAPAVLDACRYALAVADGAELSTLQQAAQVADDYSTPQRVLGLYPLTRLAFAAGIRHWWRETRLVFATPLAQLPVRGSLQRYVPSRSGIELTAPPRSAAFNLPTPSMPALQDLLRQHAPILEIDTVTAADRIGALHWAGRESGPRIEADVQQPVVYVRTAFTRLGQSMQLQLVYTFWFPARPSNHAFDVLAGHLDGLIWRVTLDNDGAALVYDAIHPCGCYHMFFPTAALLARPQPDTLDEGLFAPQTAPTLSAGDRIVLRLASRTHYLQRVSVEPAAAAHGIRYEWRDENQLRALPISSTATRSTYDPAGFIAGTERPERFLFWPMGIASAGQMRQWGRHATAFVGRRHFDDPTLFEEYFQRRNGGAATPDPSGVPDVADFDERDEAAAWSGTDVRVGSRVFRAVLPVQAAATH